MERYDAVIIGSGPAGLSAAVNLAIRNKRFLLLGPGRLSAKLEVAPKIENYLGLPGITGAELSARFSEHLGAMGIEVLDRRVSSVYALGGYYAVAAGQDAYEATCVILATGAAPVSVLPGEERLLGKGVGYCATCDAPLYKGKSAIVLGWSDEAVREANFLSELAAKVYYIPMRKTKTQPVIAVEVVSGPALELLGDKRFEAVRLADRTLEADGVFVLRDSIAPATLLPGLTVENGFIKVDADMRTNLPGCYAAGDCTGKPHQYMRAAGQGQTAALAAVAYLDELKVT